MQFVSTRSSTTTAGYLRNKVTFFNKIRSKKKSLSKTHSTPVSGTKNGAADTPKPESNQQMGDVARAVSAAISIQKNFRAFRDRMEFQGLTLRKSGSHIDAKLSSQQMAKVLSQWNNSQTMNSSSRSLAEPSGFETFDEHYESLQSRVFDRKRATMKKAWKLAILKKAANLGKGGLSNHVDPMMLMEQHWIEACDFKHRYGSNLVVYYEAWKHSSTTQDFFYWLDYGEGKEIDFEGCRRSDLEAMCVKYCTPTERLQYVVQVDEHGLMRYKESDCLIHPKGDDKLIFVIDAGNQLYIADKVKGRFHHSSFLSGNMAVAAGSMVVEHGVLRKVTPHSGHYRPTQEQFDRMINNLQEQGIDMSHVELALPKGPKKFKKLHNLKQVESSSTEK